MTCRHARSLFEAYLDQEFSAAELAELESHLSTCVSCREELESERHIREILRRKSAPEPPRGYFGEMTRLVLARTVDHATEVTSLPVPMRRGDSTLLTSLVSVAASLLLMVGAFYLGQDRPAAAFEPTTKFVASAPASTFRDAGINRDALNSLADPDKLEDGALLLSPPGPLSRHDILTGIRAR